MKKVLLVMVILIASLSLVSTKEHKDHIALDFGDAGGGPVIV